MNTNKLKKTIIKALPYVLIGFVCTNLGEAWRLAEGADASKKLLSFFSMLGPAFANPLPSFHPVDLLVGAVCGGALWLAVYIRHKNAKHFKHNQEYGSARWGTHADIEPFMDPVFQNNVILTQTERITMSNRPKNPANARNKNVLIVGGSGSGKTRFWLKPNLLQMHSSYVVTDPKGSILVECGHALQAIGKYEIKVFNTINFSKSMHYNPFAYIHSEKDILKLVTTLIANTKGDGKSGDEFWTKAETLLYDNESIYLIIDGINEAINAGKKISFLYFKYDVRKEPKLRNEGKPFVFSPHRLVWNGDFYYMVGVFDNGKRVGTFRLDRIMKRPDILKEDALPFPAGFDFEKHLQTSFRMYGTDYTTVDLICKNDLMDAILDKFGKDVTTYCYDMENFRAEVDVVVSSVFFSWVFGFEGEVVINGPADVKEQYKEMVLKTAETVRS